MWAFEVSILFGVGIKFQLLMYTSANISAPYDIWTLN